MLAPDAGGRAYFLAAASGGQPGHIGPFVGPLGKAVVVIRKRIGITMGRAEALVAADGAIKIIIRIQI